MSRIADRAAAFRVVVALSVAFIVLTVIAMLLYPGGSVTQPDGSGYAFFRNFFSDLGQTHVKYGGSGANNTPSLVLFCIALALVSGGLVVFFVTFARLFERSRTAIWCARGAMLCGIATGVGFLGVAATPWNLYLEAHNAFVVLAFRAYLAGVLLLIAACIAERGVPSSFAVAFATFAAILAAYVALLAFGPPASDPAGSVVQATGQKIIVYASVLTILVQSLLALRLARVGNVRERPARNA